MVNPVLVEQEPEPDIEAAIRRRSSNTPIPTSDSLQQSSPSQAYAVEAQSPLPTVTGKDYHRPSLLIRSTSDRTGAAHNERHHGSSSSGGGNRPPPSPESVLGLPVGSAAAQHEHKDGTIAGMELNRAETNETMPSGHQGHDGDDDEAVPEVTWKASFIVSRVRLSGAWHMLTSRTLSNAHPSSAPCLSPSQSRGVCTSPKPMTSLCSSHALLLSSRSQLVSPLRKLLYLVVTGLLLILQHRRALAPRWRGMGRSPQCHLRKRRRAAHRHHRPRRWAD